MWAKNKSATVNEETHQIEKNFNWAKSDLLFFKKGQIIYFEGSSPQGVFIIEKGRVKISQKAPNGKEFVTHIATLGEILGYSSLFSHTRYINSAIAMEDTVLTFIYKNDFLKSLKEQQEVLEQFIDQLCIHSEEVEKKAANLAYKPVRGRLAGALVQLNRKFNQTEDERQYLAITRKDLASLIGTVKETVNRLLSEFRNEELIDTNGTKIYILDAQGLQQVSEMYD